MSLEATTMPDTDHIPGVTNDPVLARILDGRARTLHEAEEQYLDESLADVFALIGTCGHGAIRAAG